MIQYIVNMITYLGVLSEYDIITLKYSFKFNIIILGQPCSVLPLQEFLCQSVTFKFENGVKLTTFMNPQTKKHPVTCDCCGFIVDLGISTSRENTINKKY